MLKAFQKVPLHINTKIRKTKFYEAKDVILQKLMVMKVIIVILLSLTIFSCETTDRLEAEIASIPMEVNVTRFDKEFAKATADDLPYLKKTYPMFFPKQIADSVWVSKFSDTIQQQLDAEVLKAFPDNKVIDNQLKSLFQHIKYYFPKFTAPKIFTVTSDVDYKNKIIAADSLLIIGIDNYLGADHFFYEGIQTYISKNQDPSQLAPDVVAEYASQLVAIPEDRTLLSQMIYYGKALYLADVLVPYSSNADKIGYTEDEWLWAQENEIYMWRYFVENELLYSTERDLAPRFLNPAPFSKFYLEIDNESPGQLGRYIGWQIVRSYMEKNDVTPQELLSKNSKEIFEKSKYKPKK